MIATGLVGLVALHWLRRRFTGWTRYASDHRMVGYVAPLTGLALALTGAGMFWRPSAIGTDVLNDVLLGVFLAGLACIALAFLAVLGVPMPPVLLPRWYRRAGRPGPQQDPDGGVAP